MDTADRQQRRAPQNGLMLAIAADAREFDGLAARLDRVQRLDWPLDFVSAGTLGGRRWLLCANGPGPRLAARAVDEALDRERPAAILSTGFCGGLDPALQACQVFVARRILDEPTGDRFETAHESGGTLISGDHVVTTLPEKAALHQTTGAGAVDMEASAVARAAGAAGLPLFCIRVVTDTAWESLPMDFNQVRDDQGRFSRLRIAAQALAKPNRLAGLMQLDRRTRDASTALGEYLATGF